ncbi:hypothetical protein F0562_034914 [Nyssa sinensis]|uniref:N-acetyltransferase domain-containing protein n=1 Tax=Nyssa sinensis TaxID=561372 RepID=A0A5J5ADT8_9ASTE|nr:hypothetical protein F0562_034914 [Nyssa sinensis]
MDDNVGNKILIREFNEDRDTEVVMKLEKNCEIGSKEGISIFTNIMDNPLCRIRLYPVHVMLVAELLENGELVGMVQGCIKYVGTGFGGRHVKLGCILGLRVSPRHRRIGIGLKLVHSMEEWMMRNDAEYTFLATEEKNVASTNLFTHKCSYEKFSSLIIYFQPVSLPAKRPSLQDIKIEKLPIDQAISFYKDRLRSKDIYPVDIDAILKEKLSLGTWVSYFKEDDDWIGLNLHNKDQNDEDVTDSSKTPSSWAIVSIWNTSEAYRLQIRRCYPFKFFHTTLNYARDIIFPCLKLKLPAVMSDSLSLEEVPFGFLFLYGIQGEGERVGELMKSLWSFASSLAENVDCKAIMTELGVTDPLREHVPQGSTSSMSCINDLWYFKRVNGPSYDEDDLTTKRPVGNVFVDPRDF